MSFFMQTSGKFARENGGLRASSVFSQQIDSTWEKKGRFKFSFWQAQCNENLRNDNIGPHIEALKRAHDTVGLRNQLISTVIPR